MTSRSILKIAGICIFSIALAAWPGMARSEKGGQNTQPSGQGMQDREKTGDQQNYYYGPDWEEGHRGKQRQQNLEGEDYGPTPPGMQRDYYGPDPKGGPEGIKELPPDQGGGIDEGGETGPQDGQQQENDGMF